MDDKKECASFWPTCASCGTMHSKQLTRLMLIVGGVCLVFLSGWVIGRRCERRAYFQDSWKGRTMMDRGDRYGNDNVGWFEFSSEVVTPPNARLTVPIPAPAPIAPKIVRPPTTTPKPVPAPTPTTTVPEVKY